MVLWIGTLVVLLIWTAPITSIPAERQSNSASPLVVGGIFDANDDLGPALFKDIVKAASSANNINLVARPIRVPNHNEGLIKSLVCSIFGFDVVAVVSDVDPVVTAAVANITDRLQIPLLSVRANLRPRPSSLVLEPTFESVMRAVHRAMGSKSNRPVTLILSKGSDIEKSKLKKIFGDESQFFLWKLIANLPAFLDDRSDDKTFVLDVPARYIKKFLAVVRTKGMDGADYSYFFITRDGKGLDLSAHKTKMRARVQLLSIVPLLESEKATGAAGKLRYMIAQRKMKPTPEIPINTALMYDAVQLLAKSLADLSKVQLISTQRLSCSGKRTWSQGLSLVNKMHVGLPIGVGVTGPLTFRNRNQGRSDFLPRIYDYSKGVIERLRKRAARASKQSALKGKQLRIVTLSENLFVTKTQKNGKTVYGGFSIELLKLLAESTGFNYTIYDVPDGFYGMQNTDGRWNGMIGELESKNADMAIGPITITYQRELAVDFTMPYMQVSTQVLAFRPTGRRTNAFAFLQPLTPSVWILMIIAYVIVSFAIFVVAKLSPYEWKRPQPGADVRVNQFGLLTAFWFAIAGTLLHYPGMAPRSTSARVIAAFWWLVVLLFFLIYAVNLAPFLTSERMDSPVSSITDLAILRTGNVGAVAGGSTQNFFKTSTIPLYSEIYKQMTKDRTNFMKSNAAGIERVINSYGSYYFIGENVWLKQATQSNCQLMILSGSIANNGYGIPLQNNSPYRKEINSALLKMQRDQRLAQLQRDYLWKKSTCSDSGSMPAVSSVSLSQMYGIFIIGVIGLVLGLVCLVLETIYKRCCGQAEQSNTTPLSDLRESLTSTKRTIA